jgi:hypothetical protein
MKPAEKNRLFDPLFDELEPLILAAIQKTGKPLCFMLHVGMCPGPGSMITNVPIDKAVEFSTETHGLLLDSMKKIGNRG